MGEVKYSTLKGKSLNKTKQCMYKRKNKARSCNHCCLGKAISITYFECVSVALGIQHSMRMRHIVIGKVSVSTLLFHIFS